MSRYLERLRKLERRELFAQGCTCASRRGQLVTIVDYGQSRDALESEKQDKLSELDADSWACAAHGRQPMPILVVQLTEAQPA